MEAPVKCKKCKKTDFIEALNKTSYIYYEWDKNRKSYCIVEVEMWKEGDEMSFHLICTNCDKVIDNSKDIDLFLENI